MVETRRRFLATVGASIAVAGCQDGGGDGSTPTETATPADGSTPTEASTPTDASTPTPEPATEVSVRAHDEHGDILVDGEGMTLYMFDSDTQGAGESTCGDGCMGAWPPLTGEDPVAGDGVETELSTFERSDGDTQIAANGWPLYYYSPDSEPGDATGQGVSDVWWVLDPAGEPIRGG